MDDWTPELDKTLQECVVKSQFNFDLVAIEVANKAKNEMKSASSKAVGATNSYSSEMCRLRWSYIHLMRKVNKKISYDPEDHERERFQ